MALFSKTVDLELAVDGMTCGNCVAHVTDALRAVPGVKRVFVVLDSKKASITAKQEVTKEQLIAAVEGAGYSAT